MLLSGDAVELKREELLGLGIELVFTLGENKHVLGQFIGEPVTVAHEVLKIDLLILELIFPGRVDAGYEGVNVQGGAQHIDKIIYGADADGRKSGIQHLVRNGFDIRAGGLCDLLFKQICDGGSDLIKQLIKSDLYVGLVCGDGVSAVLLKF